MRTYKNNSVHSRNIRRKWNQRSSARRKKYSANRYCRYYESIMEPIWNQCWEKDLKRLKSLKKEILSLGPIPQKESQLISTVNYFIKYLNILTSFVDNDLLKYSPIVKANSVQSFNNIISTLVAREKDSSYYINKAGKNQNVTINNLYLGLFVPITEEDSNSNIKIKKINNSFLKVEVDFYPFSDWINNKVLTVNGYPATISQKTLAKLLIESQSLLFNAIEDILD